MRSITGVPPSHGRSRHACSGSCTYSFSVCTDSVVSFPTPSASCSVFVKCFSHMTCFQYTWQFAGTHLRTCHLYNNSIKNKWLCLSEPDESHVHLKRWDLPVQRMPLCSIAPRVSSLCAILPRSYCKPVPRFGNTESALRNCVFARALVWSVCTALPVTRTSQPSPDIQHTSPVVPAECTLYTGCPGLLQEQNYEHLTYLQNLTPFWGKSLELVTGHSSSNNLQIIRTSLAQ
jgi:hypothetical protein